MKREVGCFVLGEIWILIDVITNYFDAYTAFCYEHPVNVNIDFWIITRLGDNTILIARIHLVDKNILEAFEEFDGKN